MPPFIDLSNMTFGRLTVLSRGADHTSKGQQKSATWKCICICGREVYVRGSFLRTGKTKSCGCLQKEVAAEIGQRLSVVAARANSRRTHGMYCTGLSAKVDSHRSEYNSWTSMIRRCEGRKDKHFKNYGQRGISICKEWKGLDGFKTFLSDMGEKPADKRTIERKDNDKDYCPDNCIWADRVTQANNKSRAKKPNFISRKLAENTAV